MRIAKALLLSFFIFIYSTTLTGCWNYRELDKMSIVAGVAIDKSPDDRYLITVEIVETQSGQEAKNIAKTITTVGDTIFDSVRNIISLSGKRLYWAHTKILVLSQDIAKEDIIKILDFLNRNHEIRGDVTVLVSKEKTAREILTSKALTNDIISFELDDMVQNENDLAKAPNVQIEDFIIDLAGEGIAPIAAAIGIDKSQNEQSPQIIGTALFAEKNFTGFLDGEETKYLLFVRDLIGGGLLVQNGSGENNTKVTLEIFNNKTKVKPVLNSSVLEMVIDIETTVANEEIQGSENYMEEAARSKLEKDAESNLNNNIANLIAKVQSEYYIDIFGFGAKIKQEMPEVWREMEPDWSNEFKNIKVTINSKIHIKNSGIMSKPLPVRD